MPRRNRNKQPAPEAGFTVNASDGAGQASLIVVDEFADVTEQQFSGLFGPEAASKAQLLAAGAALSQALGGDVHVVEAVSGPTGGTFRLRFGRFESELLGAGLPEPNASLTRALEGVCAEVERIVAEQRALTTMWTAAEWESLRKRLALENIPPQGRVLNNEELRWLALFCPSCYKSRADCACIWP